MKEDDKTGTGIGVGTFALGALAGAIAGILFAPKTGRETREDIKGTLTQMKDEIAQKLGDLKEVTQETYNNVVDSVIATYKEARALSEQQASEIKSDLAKGYDDIREAAQQRKDQQEAT